MIAVDVNVLAYLWIPGEFSSLAEQALDRDPAWVSPLLWRSEFRNILASYLRRGALSRERVFRCLEGAESQMSGSEYTVSSGQVMDLVSASSCSAYDCEYVALADHFGVPLVTSDRQVLRDFPDRTVSLRDFAVQGRGTGLP